MIDAKEITPTGYTRTNDGSEGKFHDSKKGVYWCFIYRSGDWLTIRIFNDIKYGDEARMAARVPSGTLTQETIDQIVEVLERHVDDIVRLSNHIEEKHERLLC